MNWKVGNQTLVWAIPLKKIKIKNKADEKVKNQINILIYTIGSNLNTLT